MSLKSRLQALPLPLNLSLTTVNLDHVYWKRSCIYYYFLKLFLPSESAVHTIVYLTSGAVTLPPQPCSFLLLISFFPHLILLLCFVSEFPSLLLPGVPLQWHQKCCSKQGHYQLTSNYGLKMGKYKAMKAFKSVTITWNASVTWILSLARQSTNLF